MRASPGPVRALLVLLLVLNSAALIRAAGKGFGRKKELVPTIKTDVKYIKCEVCQLVAKHAHRSVADLRAQQPSWKKLSEEEILTHLESICNSQKEEGEWITRVDVQEEGDRLRAVEKPEVRGTSAAYGLL